MMKRVQRNPVVLSLACWTLGWVAAIAIQAGEDKADPQPEPQEEKLDEKDARERFWRSYTGAPRPELKADAVFMLRGLQEPESLRVIAGLLGDGADEVRRNACRVMAETVDPDAYFVKPLTGALNDKSQAVRIAAAHALSTAKVKAKAIHALLYAFQTAQEKEPHGNELSDQIHEALMELTGQKFGKGEDPKTNLQAWLKYWQENKKRIKEDDEAYRAKRQPKTQEKK